jgi:hypothetical protein
MGTSEYGDAAHPSGATRRREGPPGGTGRPETAKVRPPSRSRIQSPRAKSASSRKRLSALIIGRSLRSSPAGPITEPPANGTKRTVSGRGDVCTDFPTDFPSGRLAVARAARRQHLHDSGHAARRCPGALKAARWFESSRGHSQSPANPTQARPTASADMPLTSLAISLEGRAGGAAAPRTPRAGVPVMRGALRPTSSELGDLSRHPT